MHNRLPLMGVFVCICLILATDLKSFVLLAGGCLGQKFERVSFSEDKAQILTGSQNSKHSGVQGNDIILFLSRNTRLPSVFVNSGVLLRLST